MMQQTDFIANNPLRVLGVYVGDSMAKEVNNLSRIAAYSKVGRTAAFAMRGDDRLPPLERTEGMAADARQRLTLPKDRLRYALFWYGTPENVELNNAIDALTEGRLSDAFSHYVTMINDGQQLHAFIQAATHGLLLPAKDKVLEMLIQALEEMDELPTLMRKQRCVEEFFLLRPEVESTGIFLKGIRAVYGFDNPRYTDYLYTAIVNISNSGKCLDEEFNLSDFFSLVQLELHLEVCEAAHSLILEAVNGWMAAASAEMQKMTASFLAPYDIAHSRIMALAPDKRRKIKRDNMWSIVRTSIWLIILFLLAYF